MRYLYFFWYKEEKDQFYAQISYNNQVDPVFIINNTEELIDLIKTGKMNHIDDTEGLTTFLKEIKILHPYDYIILDKDTFL